MNDCPFLSTYEEQIECFKECALYNYASTGGECPFKHLKDTSSSYVSYSKDAIEKDFDFLKDYYKTLCNCNQL